MAGNIDALKRQAKLLARQFGRTHSEALDELARQRGYSNWSHLMKATGHKS